MDHVQVIPAPYNKHRRVTVLSTDREPTCETCQKQTLYPCTVCGQCAEESQRNPNERRASHARRNHSR